MTRTDYKIYLLLKKFSMEKAHDFLIEKRKKDREAIVRNSKVIHEDDYCYWIEKTIYPFEFTMEDMENYMENNWLSIHSLYDCTGETFTRDIKFFIMQGKTIVYHFKAIDC